MENRTGSSSFVISLAAIVVALVTFLARSAPPQTTITTLTGTSAATTAGNPDAPVSNQGTASDQTTTDTTSPIKTAADSLVAIMNAQTERAKSDANARTEQFKAESARLKDNLDVTRQHDVDVCDCIYKFALLVLGFVLALVLLPRLTGLTFFGVIFTLSPTKPPDPPAGAEMMEAGDAEAPRMFLTHEVVRSLVRREPHFVIRLQGDLAVVSEVTYYLHTSYDPPVRVVKTAPFELDIPAIGKFLLYADVKLAGGKVVRLQRYLDE